MVFSEVFKPFVEDSPVSVMFRGTLENLFSPERLDELFAETAQTQRPSELLFSTCADMMALVVSSRQKSINLAYTERKESLGVSVNAVYDKLKGIEPAVSERMVLDTAADAAELIREMAGEVEGRAAETATPRAQRGRSRCRAPSGQTDGPGRVTPALRCQALATCCRAVEATKTQRR